MHSALSRNSRKKKETFFFLLVTSLTHKHIQSDSRELCLLARAMPSTSWTSRGKLLSRPLSSHLSCPSRSASGSFSFATLHHLLHFSFVELHAARSSSLCYVAAVCKAAVLLNFPSTAIPSVNSTVRAARLPLLSSCGCSEQRLLALADFCEHLVRCARD